MPPPSDHAALHLKWLKGDFFVAQLQPGEPIPEPWIALLTTPNLGPAGRQLFSITVAPEETSIVGEAEYQLEGKESTWKCIQIAGPMDFGLIGVISSFTAPLKEKGIGVFVTSTWNTDFILVPKERAQEAHAALSEDGWKWATAEVI